MKGYIHMIIDVTGIILTPGNGGIDCLGTGEHIDKDGNLIECCCDECDYLLCCVTKDFWNECRYSTDLDCPRRSEG